MLSLPLDCPYGTPRLSQEMSLPTIIPAWRAGNSEGGEHAVCVQAVESVDASLNPGPAALELALQGWALAVWLGCYRAYIMLAALQQVQTVPVCWLPAISAWPGAEVCFWSYAGARGVLGQEQLCLKLCHDSCYSCANHKYNIGQGFQRRLHIQVLSTSMFTDRYRPNVLRIYVPGHWLTCWTAEPPKHCDVMLQMCLINLLLPSDAKVSITL